MLVVDPVVDDGDLDALPPRPRRGPELRRAEDGWATVQVQMVRVARIHLRRDPRIEELRQAGVGDAHREAVDEHLVPARHDRVGHRPVQVGDRSGLLRLERAQVRARERTPHVQLLPDPETGEPACVRGCRERRALELHDHPYAVAPRATDVCEVGRGSDLQERLLDDALRRPVDGTGSRAGAGNDCDE